MWRPRAARTHSAAMRRPWVGPVQGGLDRWRDRVMMHRRDAATAYGGTRPAGPIKPSNLGTALRLRGRMVQLIPAMVTPCSPTSGPLSRSPSKATCWTVRLRSRTAGAPSTHHLHAHSQAWTVHLIVIAAGDRGSCTLPPSLGPVRSRRAPRPYNRLVVQHLFYSRLCQEHHGRDE